MYEYRINITRLGRHKRTLRLIALTVIFTFMLSNMAWTYPEFNPSKTNTLIPKSMFDDQDNPEVYEKLAFKWLLEFTNVELRNLQLAASEEALGKVRKMLVRKFLRQVRGATDLNRIANSAEKGQVHIKIQDFFVRFFDPKVSNLQFHKGLEIVGETQEFSKRLHFQILRQTSEFSENEISPESKFPVDSKSAEENIKKEIINGTSSSRAVIDIKPIERIIAKGNFYDRHAEDYKQEGPFLAPIEGVHWEDDAVTNASIFQLEDDKDMVYIMYRAIKKDDATRDGKSSIGIVTVKLKPIDSESPEGERTIDLDSIKRYPLPIMCGRGGGLFDANGCEDPRVEIIDGKIIITYVAVREYPLGNTLIEELDALKLEVRENTQSTFFAADMRLNALLNKQKQHGWSGYQFGEAATAAMSISDFKERLQEWDKLREKNIDTPGILDDWTRDDINNTWQWHRKTVNHKKVDGVEYTKDSVIFKDNKGQNWMLDRPEVLDSNGHNIHPIRFRRYDSSKKRWEKLGKYIWPRGREKYKEQWLGAGTPFDPCYNWT